MRQIMTELGSPPTLATIIYEDNQAAISMTKNLRFQRCANHIAIKYHFIREQVKDGTVKLNYCPTEEMTADNTDQRPEPRSIREATQTDQNGRNTSTVRQQVRRSVGTLLT